MKSKKAAKPKITFSTQIDILKTLPGMRYLPIPATVVKGFGNGTLKQRVLCTVHGPGKKSVTFQGGFMSLGQGRAYLSITRKRMKEAGVEDGARVKVTLKVDTSKYGMPMPEELKALLDQDDEGRRRFEALSMAMQRYTLFYVGGVKSEEKRLERAILLITNLKLAPEGRETFRQMLGKWD